MQTLRAPATVWPPMARLGALAARSPTGAAAAVPLAGEIGRAIGDELAALGFDMNFAPVLDVLANAKNRVIGDRAFAATADAVTPLGGAVARGLASAGILCCGKHFPGHGRTDADSHFTLPVVAASRAELDAVELAPFRAMVDRLPLIMTAHVAYLALDPGVPATLSPRVVQGLLRDTLGFRGVVVSDDLEMGAITRHLDVGEAAVRALLAGCDGLLMDHWPNSLRRARAALPAPPSTAPKPAAGSPNPPPASAPSSSSTPLVPPRVPA